jgi:hypothetical protein
MRRFFPSFMIGKPVTSADPVENFQEQITVNVVSEKRAAPVTTESQKV